MIVLHAGFCEESLLVWREPEQGANPLLKALALAGPNFEKKRKDVEEAIAWVPMRSGHPVPSTELLTAGAAQRGECYLAPGIVSVVTLDPKDAVAFLALAGAGRVLAPGVLCGDTLLYCAAAVRFAAGLVRRGHFLPSAHQEKRKVYARWLPVIADSDNRRFHALAAAMPPAVRSITWDSIETPPAQTAESALSQFLAPVVDHLVRNSVPAAQASVNGANGSAAAKKESPEAADTLHDRWRAALTAPAAEFKATPSEIKQLAEQIKQWQRPVEIAAKSNLRLCFRVEEPPRPGAAWRVDYLLQDLRDPIRLIPAQEIWSPAMGAVKATGYTPAKAREYLLASLGRAAALSTGVEGSLREKNPCGFVTNTNGAHEFLKKNAPALEQSGFGVIVPPWWTRRIEFSLQVRMHVDAARQPCAVRDGGFNLEALLRFEWELAIAGEPVSRQELEKLVRLRLPMVRVRGKWVEINQEAVQRAIDFMESKPYGKATLRELIRAAMAGIQQEGPVSLGGVTATGWLDTALKQLQGKIPYELLPQPPGLSGEMRPYQIRGYSWLVFLKQMGLGACLADDMGLGKTLQTLALIEKERAEGEKRPALIVCPTSVVTNWEKEAAKFTPELKVLVHHGADRHDTDTFKTEARQYNIVISTYSLLYRDQAALRSVDWSGVILDEAQNVKNADTRQAKAAQSLRGLHRIALSGTPVENHVGDLWSIMEFLNPGFLGTRSWFRTHYQVPIQVYSDAQAVERLRRITGPFVLRRLKTDRSIIADLPEKLEMKVFCNLTREQGKLYEAVVEEAEKQLNEAQGIARKGVVLATLTKLKQVCNHPAQYLKDGSAIKGRSGKLARLTEMIEETIESQDRSLIFTQFTEMGEIIQNYLQERFGEEVLYLHGGTPKKQRDRMVDRFAHPRGPRFFLLSLKAGGTGLNLTSANHVFHFDRWWNPAVENQATDRAFRIGQTRNVQVHKFICAGTLEERIDEMIDRKKGVAGGVVGTGEAWLTELSNDELKQLFALRKDQIGEE